MRNRQGVFDFAAIAADARRAYLNPEEGEGFLDGVGDEENGALAVGEHALFDAVVEEGEQGVVEAVGVEQKDGLGVEFEGVPGEDFEEFFERAEAAGEGDEGAGALADEGLAGVHGVGDVEFSEGGVGDFKVDQDRRDDADDAAAGVERGFGDGLHEADVGAAVHHADVAGRKGLAEFDGGGAVGRVGAVGGGAEDGDVGDGRSG